MRDPARPGASSRAACSRAAAGRGPPAGADARRRASGSPGARPRVAGLALDGCGPPDRRLAERPCRRPLEVPLGSGTPPRRASGPRGPGRGWAFLQPMGGASGPVPLGRRVRASGSAKAGPAPSSSFGCPTGSGTVMAAPWRPSRGPTKRLTVAGPARWIELLAPVPARLRGVPLGRGAPAEVARGTTVPSSMGRRVRLGRFAGPGSRVACGARGRALLASHAVRAAHRWGQLARTPRPFSATARELLGALPAELGAVHDPTRGCPSLPMPGIGRVLLQELGVEEPFILVNAGARPGRRRGCPRAASGDPRGLEARVPGPRGGGAGRRPARGGPAGDGPRPRGGAPRPGAPRRPRGRGPPDDHPGRRRAPPRPRLRGPGPDPLRPDRPPPLRVRRPRRGAPAAAGSLRPLPRGDLPPDRSAGPAALLPRAVGEPLQARSSGPWTRP